jgi:LPXTG-motif cell wall-anchored protein
MARKLRRRIAAVLITALAAFTVILAAPATPALAIGTTDPAGAAAGWLARQLTDGDHFEVTFGNDKFPDAGLTIDAALAFVAAGVSGDSLTKAVDWLSTPANTGPYIGDGVKESYVGATAKLAYLAGVLGKDPTSFAGVDLVDRLGDLLQPSGQYQDTSAFGDFSNTIGQSLAILALLRTPGGAPASAVQFLASTQCDDGGFPVTYGPCTSSDADGTAYVVQALAAAGDTTHAAQGLAWLLSKQDAATGGVGGTGPTAGLNANTTGLAAVAFRVSKKDSEADKAVAFLRTLQVGCGGPAEHAGAIALAAGANGPDFQLDTASRATPQAVLGFAGIGLADLKLKRGITPEAPTLTLSCPNPVNPVLPVTGSSLTPVVVAGAALLVLGFGLVLLVRRRRPVRG